MSWQPELDELRRREELARRMGGPERVERQHASGRLTVRERIERLLDPGSFHETGALAGRASYGADGEIEDFLPANVVVGHGRVDGRRVSVQGDDFTVRGGAADAAIWEKAIYAERLAHDMRIPLVRLVDGTGGGGSVKTLEDMGFSYVPPLPGFEVVVRNLAIVPVATAALGPVAGLGAARVVCSHFSVIVRGTAQLFVAGPPVVAAAMGEAPDKEELGGARMQARAGAVDNVAADEDDALAQLRRFLSYLPSSVWEAPPVVAASDPPDRREEELLSIVPRERRRTYKMRRILAAVFDRDSVFELGATFGRPVITALARLGGRPVGVLASDTEHYGGGVTADASEKLARFVDTCDQFHLPIVNLVDVPGFVIGTEAERAGTIRRGGRALFSVYQASVPWVSVLVRKVLRRGGCRARRRIAAEPSLRLAVGRLGVPSDRGRTRSRLPARARGRRRPGGATGRDRRAPRRRALAVQDRGALQRRGDHRPARHASAPLRLGRARPRAGRPGACRWPEGARTAPLSRPRCATRPRAAPGARRPASPSGATGRASGRGRPRSRSRACRSSSSP